MAIQDRYGSKQDPGPGPITGPLIRGATVAPNDGADLTFLPRAIHVGTAGNIKMTVGGASFTTAYEVGWHPIRPSRIWAAGLTAADITAWD